MKKIIAIFLAILLFVGCGEKGSNEKKNQNNDSGKVTEYSKKYLSKGYIVNVYRNMISLSDSLEDMGKGNVQIIFNVLVEYYLNIDYQNENDYIISQSVKNVKVIKSPKKGTVNDIYLNYLSYLDPDFKIVGTNNVYTKKYDTPTNYPNQNSIAFILDNVAFMDSYAYKGENNTKAIYNYLGIDHDAVSMQVAFRIEFVTKENKTLYKDYLIDLPPASYDISGSEYQTRFMTEDVSQMEPFKEL